jgi:hypothetical protein
MDDDPQVVSRDQWLAARRELLAEEKECTRQRDALNFVAANMHYLDNFCAASPVGGLPIAHGKIS